MIGSTMETQFFDQGDILLVVCKGEWIPDGVTRMLEGVREKTLALNQSRVLLDWRGVSKPEKNYYRIRGGVEVAEIVPRHVRLAVVYHQALINKLAENVAVNRGAGFRVCGDWDEAMGWLFM